MKKLLLPLLAVTVLACNNNKSKQDDKASNTDTSATTGAVSTNAAPAADTTTFDINKIPVSDKDPGQFPFLALPKGYTYNYNTVANPKDIRDLDKEYFAVKGKLMPITGKTYKTMLEKDRNKDEKRFNSLEVEEALSAQIKALGGVQVNNVALPSSELERIGNAELIDKRYGHSIDFNLLDQIKTFVIRTKTKQIWIQMTLMNDESGKLTVLEK